MNFKMENFGFWLSKKFAAIQNRKAEWPHVPGKYFIHDPRAPVAVTTLGSISFANDINEAEPENLCIVGKVETENIGIEKIIKNIIANPAIRFLLMVGKEPPKHLTGATLSALFANGVDDIGRIVGSPGMRPVLPNTNREELARFLDQVELVDMIGCMDIEEVKARINDLASHSPGHYQSGSAIESPPAPEVTVVSATYHDPQEIKLDQAGYFVIHPEEEGILVEHYSYKEELLRIIKGDNARDIYLTIVDNGWVSHLDHACYLGKELIKAEQSHSQVFNYLQYCA